MKTIKHTSLLRIIPTSFIALLNSDMEIEREPSSSMIRKRFPSAEIPLFHVQVMQSPSVRLITNH